MEALEMYGVGNWGAVAEHVGVKTPPACKAHYYQIYMDSHTCPLPQPVPELLQVDISELMHRKVQPIKIDTEGTRGAKRTLDGGEGPLRFCSSPAVPSVQALRAIATV